MKLYIEFFLTVIFYKTINGKKSIRIGNKPSEQTLFIVLVRRLIIKMKFIICLKIYLMDLRDVKFVTLIQPLLTVQNHLIVVLNVP